MARPSWYPDIQPGTSQENTQAILDCQGEWWTWGGSVCKKPKECVAERSCYFVRTAAKHQFPLSGIRWIPGFDEREAA